MRRALVVLAAAPLLLAACGGGSSSSRVSLTPTAYVLQAAKKSAQATSEHVEMAASMTALGQSVTMTGDGDFDSVKHVGSMTVHVGLQGIDMQIDEVQDGTTIYMKSPLLGAALPQGKTWVKIDLEQVGKSKGFDFSQLMGQDPSQSFSQLEASGRVTKIGDETIDGAETTHYRGHIDTAKLPPAFAHLAAKYGAYDVWVGKDDGYVRRLQTSYTVAKQSVSMTMNFSDFGKDVSVEVPPASETADGSTGIDSIGG
jgi:hypothetical protein